MKENKKAAPSKVATSKPKRKAVAIRKPAAKTQAKQRPAPKPTAQKKGIQPGEVLTLKSGRTITKSA